VRRYWILVATVFALILTTYLLAEALHAAVLTDPASSLSDGGWAAAALGVLLLVGDQFVPVPSSLVMISLGAIYGVPAGIALSLTGRVGMAAAGFAVGRAGGPLLKRLVSERDRAVADAMLRRRGVLAVLLSRPLPLLAETVAVMAGASSLRWSRVLPAAAIGSLPEVVAYSLAGAIAPGFDNAALIWGSFIALAVAFWFLDRRISRAAPGSDGAALVDGPAS
jgi:uncharacterized membrane protein YdjX (TVP38/TMEM64 family)